MALQVIPGPPFNASGPNAANNLLGGMDLPESGWVYSVRPGKLSSAAVPRGRYFARVVLYGCPLNQLTTASAGGFFMTNLWEGYLSGDGPCSFPGLPLAPGLSIAVNVWSGTNGATTDQFALEIVCSDTMPGSGAMWQEFANTGPGERFIASNTPAAGSDASYTIGSFVRQTHRSIRDTLVTSATAGNRTVRIIEQPTGTATNMDFSVIGPNQAASLTYTYVWNESYPITDTAVDAANYLRMARGTAKVCTAGGKVGTVTTGIQAADQHTLILDVEEWAGPNP